MLAVTEENRASTVSFGVGTPDEVKGTGRQRRTGLPATATLIKVYLRSALFQSVALSLRYLQTRRATHPASRAALRGILQITGFQPGFLGQNLHGCRPKRDTIMVGEQ